MTEELEGAIREVVQDFVSASTLAQLEPKTSPDPASEAGDPGLSQWYASLPEDGKSSLRKLMASVVDETIHGVLGVIDEVCEIGDHLPVEDDLDVAFVVTQGVDRTP